MNASVRLLQALSQGVSFQTLWSSWRRSGLNSIPQMQDPACPISAGHFAKEISTPSQNHVRKVFAGGLVPVRLVSQTSNARVSWSVCSQMTDAPEPARYRATVNAQPLNFASLGLALNSQNSPKPAVGPVDARVTSCAPTPSVWNPGLWRLGPSVLQTKRASKVLNASMANAAPGPWPKKASHVGLVLILTSRSVNLGRFAVTSRSQMGSGHASVQVNKARCVSGRDSVRPISHVQRSWRPKAESVKPCERIWPRAPPTMNAKVERVRPDLARPQGV